MHIISFSNNKAVALIGDGPIDEELYVRVAGQERHVGSRPILKDIVFTGQPGSGLVSSSKLPVHAFYGTPGKGSLNLNIYWYGYENVRPKVPKLNLRAHSRVVHGF